ncbi:MAG: peptidase dimerization domain-containing protein [Pseudomonadota bacterium]
MSAPTVDVGTVAGGANINAVPDHAETTVDARSIGGQDHATVRLRRHQACGSPSSGAAAACCTSQN